MRIGRILILLALILIVGVAAVYFLVLQPAQAPQAGGAQPPAQVEIPKVSVVITAQPIRRGTRIEEGMITVVEVPADSVLQSQILDPKEALGKLAVRDLPQGIFLTRGDLADSPTALGEAGSTAALGIPPGFVAISIPVSRLTSVAYALRPGDHVAVMATLPIVDLDVEFQSRLPDMVGSVTQTAGAEGATSLTPQVTLAENTPYGRIEDNENLGLPFYVAPTEPQRPRLVTQMLISNAMVLYVGTFPLQDQAAQPTPMPEEGQQPPEQQPPEEAQPTPVTPPDVVTLVVSPQDAVALKYLMDRQVVLTLALRGPGDAQEFQTEAVTLSFVIDRYHFVIPAKLPYDIEPRIDRVEMPVLPNDLPPTPMP